MKHWLIWFHSPVFPRKNATKKARLKNIYLQLNLTGIPRGIDVNSTLILPLICQRPNFDKFAHHFHVLFQCNFSGRKIRDVFTHFFLCNLDGRKIHVVSTYIFWCNFSGPKLHLNSTYFFRCNFFIRNIHGTYTYCFQRNFDGQKFDVVFGKLRTNENIRGGFPLFVTLKRWLLQYCFP